MSEVTVFFARINRRHINSLYHNRSFAEEIQLLANSRQMTATIGKKTYYAGDLEVENGMLSGLLGYTDDIVLHSFNREEWSWQKGETTSVETSKEKHQSLFAVDLDESRRWVGFTRSGYITVERFPRIFQEILRSALKALGEEGYSDWEVDLVYRGTALLDWIRDHPQLSSLEIELRMTNGLRLDEDRRQMQQLRATRAKKIYSVKPKERPMRIDLSTAMDLAEEVRTTNSEVKMTDRAKNSFSSKDPKEIVKESMNDYGDDPARGTETLRSVLLSFAHLNPGTKQTGDRTDG